MNPPSASLPFDVLVIGGGPAGVGAAVAAGRALGPGGRVALVERHPVLGGMGTAGLVNIFCNAHFDGQRLILAGVFGELRERLRARGALFAPMKKYLGEPYAPAAASEVMIDLCREAGVTLHLGRAITAITGGNTTALRLALDDGSVLVGERWVDATGDAVVAHAVGVPSTFGRDEDAAVMPLTYCFLAGPIHLDEAFAASPTSRRHDERTGIDYYYSDGLVTRKIAEAKAAGDWTVARDTGAIFSVPGDLTTVSANINRVFIDDPTDPAQLAAADAEGRRQVEEGVRFMRKYLPGFQDVRLIELARQIGVRESRQIQGLYRLTLDDVLGLRQFDDVIAQCCYGIDDHKPKVNAHEMDKLFADGTHYDIPWRCLVPASGTARGVVAGRSISADRRAMASFRVQPSCMAIGEAAGITAALSARDGRAPAETDYAEVRRHLLANGAILE